MNLDQLTFGENRKFIPQITSEIKIIAFQMIAEERQMTRRNLTNELNARIPELNLIDGVILNSLVKEAYSQASSFSAKEAITKSFCHNLTCKPVYNPEDIQDTNLSLNYSGEIDSNINKFARIAEILDGKLAMLDSKDTISVISEMKQSIDQYVPQKNFSLTGKTKVNDNVKYGKKILKGYGNLIEFYNNVKSQNHELIGDFKFLRNELGEFRENVTELLFEIIGYDEKVNRPELFDFARLEYIETDKLLEDIDLEFQKLNNSFEVFQKEYEKNMINIANAGKKHADLALNRYSKTVKRNGYASKSQVKAQVATAALGFAFDAALEIIETRNSAEQTVAAIKRDVEKMKISLKQDAQKISVDLLRLKKITSRLQTVLIPESRKFIEKANLIYDTTIKDTYSKLVEGSDIMELSMENRRLLAEHRNIHREIEDTNESIQACNLEIAKYRSAIEEIQDEFDYVNSIEPKTPPKFQLKYSFGIALRVYKNHLNTWNDITLPIRSKYAELEQFVKNEEELILQFEKLALKLQKRLKDIDSSREYNKNEIEAQGINIKDYKTKLEKLEINIRKISEASKNMLSHGIQEDDIQVAKSLTGLKSLSTIEEDAIINRSTEIVDESSIDLEHEHYRMQMKIELIKYTEMAFNGELIKNMVSDKKNHLIDEQYGKVRMHLQNKIFMNSKLDEEQVHRLVDIGSRTFVNILKVQELKAETNFLEKLNLKLDQEFLKEFERSVRELEYNLKVDEQKAKTTEAKLNSATNADDLLTVSRIAAN